MSDLDFEITCLRDAYISISSLDRIAQIRCLKWLTDRFDSEHEQKLIAEENARKLARAHKSRKAKPPVQP